MDRKGIVDPITIGVTVGTVILATICAAFAKGIYPDLEGWFVFMGFLGIFGSIPGYAYFQTTSFKIGGMVAFVSFVLAWLLPKIQQFSATLI